MKKLITKFWGVGLVIILLSTLFIGTAAPAAAADYTLMDSFLGPWSPATFIPGQTLEPVTNFGILSVAQSGSTIYAIGGNTTAGVFILEKSVDAGATWAAVTTGITPAIQRFSLVAVAPDDPNVVVLIDSQPANDVVYLSTTGGTLFSGLGTPGFGALNTVSISPLTIARYISVGGAGGLSTWTMGIAAPGWANDVTRGSIYALAYSPNFAADAGLLAVSDNVASNTTTVQVYSQNLLIWNPAGYGYPITLAKGTQRAVGANATMTLDPNFYLGDASTQIGFIGLSGTEAAMTSPYLTYQGVYRFDLNTANTASQIYSTTGVNSLAWDGTNLMVAPNTSTSTVLRHAPLTIYRSANALSPVGVASFTASSTFKTPGNGTYPLVLFNNGVGYAFSRGINSAIARTTDLGKDFNGFALINSNFNNVNDFTVSPDGGTVYAVADDTLDVNTWAFSAGAWSRVMVTSNVTGTTFLVRMDSDTPASVYLGQKNATTMYKSADGGQTWLTRASIVRIADFGVQDINTVYVAPTTTDAFVYKSITGAFTWVPYATTIVAPGVGYSITILCGCGGTAVDNQVLFGTTTGYVAYTTDGATWASLPAPVSVGNTVATADMLTTGGTIFAASDSLAVTAAISSWTLGTNVAWTAGPALSNNVTGIVEANGVVYAEKSTGLVNTIYRFLNPGFGASFFNQALLTGPVGTNQITNVNIVNTLQASGTNTLWARATNTYGPVDTLDSYTDSLIYASQAPVPIYPINNAKISVNSLNGNVANFVFQWNAPPVLPFTPLQAYTYDIGVYLDELGTIPMGLAGPVAGSLGGVTTSYNALAGGWAPALNLQPGTTYYWQVRTNTPVWSYWSPMQTFMVQQLQAVVPSLSSPVSGATITLPQTPAFAWSPISGTATYQFDVSTDPTFATTIYSTTTASAGAAIPSSVHLTAGTTYFWRVKALTPNEGDWSTVGNFSVAAAVIPPTSTTQAPAITTITTISIPPVVNTTITVPQATTVTTQVNPSYIWAIIIIGAVLVIAVIVLIVRTRRSV